MMNQNPETLKGTIETMILNINEEMAGCGYFEGVLKTMWAEMALETVNEKQAVNVYWNMRNRIGWEATN